MLLMIRINLLPVEYRKVDKAPVGLFLLIIVGLMFIFSTSFGYVFLKRKVDQLQTKLAEVKTQQKNSQKQLDEIKEKEAEIGKASLRQETIIQISMSKIIWSQKLFELSNILKKHPVWVYAIQLESDKKELTLKCFCTGTDERKVTEFRKAILKSRSFFSIFEKIDSYRDLTPVRISVPTKEDKEQENLSFTLNLRMGDINLPAPATPQQN